MRFRLEYRESILSVLCDDGLEGVAYDAMFEARSAIESKIAEDPFFGMTYDPYPASSRDPEIVRRMCGASAIAGVGPMAGVAGAVAVTIADSDSIAPTERSIPPMMITNVIPTAAIPVTDDTRRMFTRFRSARKRSGASTLNNANTNTSAQKGNNCLP